MTKDGKRVSMFFTILTLVPKLSWEYFRKHSKLLSIVKKSPTQKNKDLKFLFVNFFSLLTNIVSLQLT